eukprot:gene12597-19512_t
MQPAVIRHRELLASLCVFPADAAVPLATVARYWAALAGVSAATTARVVAVLAAEGALAVNGPAAGSWAALPLFAADAQGRADAEAAVGCGRAGKRPPALDGRARCKILLARTKAALKRLQAQQPDDPQAHAPAHEATAPAEGDPAAGADADGQTPGNPTPQPSPGESALGGPKFEADADASDALSAVSTMESCESETTADTDAEPCGAAADPPVDLAPFAIQLTVPQLDRAWGLVYPTMALAYPYRPHHTPDDDLPPEPAGDAPPPDPPGKPRSKTPPRKAPAPPPDANADSDADAGADDDDDVPADWAPPTKKGAPPDAKADPGQPKAAATPTDGAGAQKGDGSPGGEPQAHSSGGVSGGPQGGEDGPPPVEKTFARTLNRMAAALAGGARSRAQGGEAALSDCGEAPQPALNPPSQQALLLDPTSDRPTLPSGEPIGCKTPRIAVQPRPYDRYERKTGSAPPRPPATSGTSLYAKYTQSLSGASRPAAQCPVPTAEQGVPSFVAPLSPPKTAVRKHGGGEVDLTSRPRERICPPSVPEPPRDDTPELLQLWHVRTPVAGGDGRKVRESDAGQAMVMAEGDVERSIFAKGMTVLEAVVARQVSACGRIEGKKSTKHAGSAAGDPASGFASSIPFRANVLTKKAALERLHGVLLTSWLSRQHTKVRGNEPEGPQALARAVSTVDTEEARPGAVGSQGVAFPWALDGVADKWCLHHMPLHFAQAGFVACRVGPSFYITYALVEQLVTPTDLGITPQPFPSTTPPSLSTTLHCLTLIMRHPVFRAFQDTLTIPSCAAVLRPLAQASINPSLSQPDEALPLMYQGYLADEVLLPATVIALALLSPSQRVRDAYADIAAKTVSRPAAGAAGPPGEGRRGFGLASEWGGLRGGGCDFTLVLASRLIAAAVEAWLGAGGRRRAAGARLRLAELASFDLRTEFPRDWWRGTWLAPAAELLLTDGAGPEDWPLLSPGVFGVLFRLLPFGLQGERTPVQTVTALVAVSAVHPDRCIRSSAAALVRSCPSQAIIMLLLEDLHNAAAIDPCIVRDIWSEGTPASGYDEKQTSSVSGPAGTASLVAFSCFPSLASEIERLKAADYHITRIHLESSQSRSKYRTCWNQLTGAARDKWTVPSAGWFSSQDVPEGNKVITESRKALQSLVAEKDWWRAEAFNAVKRLAEDRGGRAARVVALCLLKVWDLESAARGEPARITREQAVGEVSGDIVHVVRDCLDPSDYKGISQCLRALPSEVLYDRGSLSILLTLASSHEASLVRTEASSLTRNTPPQHVDWALRYLSSSCGSIRRIPYASQSIISCCPALPDNPPPLLLSLILSEAKAGFAPARQLLRRSPSFTATAAMAHALRGPSLSSFETGADGLGDFQGEWVFGCLPALKDTVSGRLIEVVAGLLGETPAGGSSHVLTKVCAEGNEKVADEIVRRVARASSACVAEKLLKGLPAVGQFSVAVVDALIRLATAGTEAGEKVQAALRDRVTSFPDLSSASAKKLAAELRPVISEHLHAASRLALAEANPPGPGCPSPVVGPVTSTLTGVLNGVSPSFLPYLGRDDPAVLCLLQLTWRSPSVRCREGARDFFARSPWGVEVLVRHLSEVILAFVERQGWGEDSGPQPRAAEAAGAAPGEKGEADETDGKERLNRPSPGENENKGEEPGSSPSPSSASDEKPVIFGDSATAYLGVDESDESSLPKDAVSSSLSPADTSDESRDPTDNSSPSPSRVGKSDGSRDPTESASPLPGPVHPRRDEMKEFRSSKDGCSPAPSSSVCPVHSAPAPTAGGTAESQEPAPEIEKVHFLRAVQALSQDLAAVAPGVLDPLMRLGAEHEDAEVSALCAGVFSKSRATAHTLAQSFRYLTPGREHNFLRVLPRVLDGPLPTELLARLLEAAVSHHHPDVRNTCQEVIRQNVQTLGQRVDLEAWLHGGLAPMLDHLDRAGSLAGLAARQPSAPKSAGGGTSFRRRAPAAGLAGGGGAAPQSETTGLPPGVLAHSQAAGLYAGGGSPRDGGRRRCGEPRFAPGGLPPLLALLLEGMVLSPSADVDRLLACVETAPVAPPLAAGLCLLLRHEAEPVAARALRLLRRTSRLASGGCGGAAHEALVFRLFSAEIRALLLPRVEKTWRPRDARSLTRILELSDQWCLSRQATVPDGRLLLRVLSSIEEGVPGSRGVNRGFFLERLAECPHFADLPCDHPPGAQLSSDEDEEDRGRAQTAWNDDLAVFVKAWALCARLLRGVAAEDARRDCTEELFDRYGGDRRWLPLLARTLCCFPEPAGGGGGAGAPGESSARSLDTAFGLRKKAEARAKAFDAVAQAAVAHGAPWAVGLARRSPSLWPGLVHAVGDALFRCPAAPVARRRVLQQAAHAFSALPDLAAVYKTLRLHPGGTIDAICAVADGQGERDVVDALSAPARRLLMA